MTAGSTVSTTMSQPIDMEAVITRELTFYFEIPLHPRIKSVTDPAILGGSKMLQTLPTLAAVARKLKSAPASSVCRIYYF